MEELAAEFSSTRCLSDPPLFSRFLYSRGGAHIYRQTYRTQRRGQQRASQRAWPGSEKQQQRRKTTKKKSCSSPSRRSWSLPRRCGRGELPRWKRRGLAPLCKGWSREKGGAGVNWGKKQGGKDAARTKSKGVSQTPTRGARKTERREAAEKKKKRKNRSKPASRYFFALLQLFFSRAELPVAGKGTLAPDFPRLPLVPDGKPSSLHDEERWRRLERQGRRRQGQGRWRGGEFVGVDDIAQRSSSSVVAAPAPARPGAHFLEFRSLGTAHAHAIEVG